MTAGLAGSQLGKYAVLEELGQGGMSVVYRARDTQLEREVAVKVMHSFLAEQEEARERFHREAVAVARLRHPHIIEIFDYSGEEADTAYIVTEVVSGQSLSAVLEETTIEPPEAALVLARPIIDALTHAHAEGIIHRDLKPENILVSSSGALKLTDFGIARMLDNKTLTMTGTLLGSPAYMAPEYVEGYPTDERADIFSFGAMLYQLAVGILPFDGASPHALLKKIAAGSFEPADQANPQVHGQIARMLRRCLAKLPEQRYASAAELLAEVDTLLERLGIDHHAELPKLLADPKAYGDSLKERLAPTYLQLGRQNLGSGSPGAAIDDLDRVLGLDPGNHEVRKILDRMARRASARRAARSALLGLLGSVPVTLILASLIQLASAPEPPAIPPDLLEPPPLEGTTDPVQSKARNVTFALTGGAGDLWIDDELVRRRVKGLVSLTLLPGEHLIRFVGRNKTDEQSVIVPADGMVPPVEMSVYVKRKRVVLPPKIREVEFNAVRWVNVFVDDESMPRLEGVFGIFTLELSYGPHVLRFENDYGEPLRMPLNVTATTPSGRTAVKIKPLPAYLTVVGVPEGEFVVQIADKKPQLVTDETRGDRMLVPLDDLGPLERAATYDVIVRMDGHREYRKPVTFRAGEHKELAVALQPL